jgi:hypothetical protein
LTKLVFAEFFLQEQQRHFTIEKSHLQQRRDVELLQPLCSVISPAIASRLPKSFADNVEIVATSALLR